MSNELIQQLINKGLITTEDIMEAERNIVSSDMKKIIETIHLQYCSGNHDSGECAWYVEELKVDAWEMESHKHWAESFKDFLLAANQTKLIPEGVSENLASTTDDTSLSS